MVVMTVRKHYPVAINSPITSTTSRELTLSENKSNDKSCLLVATFNQGKLKEIQSYLTFLPIHLLSLETFSDVDPMVEKGKTFEENARDKASYYSRFTKFLTIADDSGLVVDALGGKPGVYSARYLSEQASDQDRFCQILTELKDIPDSKRTARFECCVALAREGTVQEMVQGTLEGVISREPRGKNGFGYDPIFQVVQNGPTLAELSSDEKIQISHRGQALRKMVKTLSLRVSS